MRALCSSISLDWCVLMLVALIEFIDTRDTDFRHPVGSEIYNSRRAAYDQKAWKYQKDILIYMLIRSICQIQIPEILHERVT